MNLDEIKCLVNRYGIHLADNGKVRFMMPRRMTKRTSADLDTIRSNKPQIVAYLTHVQDEAQEKDRLREAAIASIEGLSEIQKAIAEMEAWNAAFTRSFEDVGGMGIWPRPNYDLEHLYALYPRAHAYLRAKAQASKNNHELAAIGKRAVEAVLFGDYKEAMAEMEHRLSEFATKHVWD